MGLGGLHIWHLLIILVIVMLIFGTKRLKSIGGDLGGAIKGFKKAVNTDDDKPRRDARASRATSKTPSSPSRRRKTKAAVASARVPRCSRSVSRSSFSSPSSGSWCWGPNDFRR